MPTILCVSSTHKRLKGMLLLSEFYGEGPLRDDDGMCVSHEANTSEKRVQTILTIVSFVVSVLVFVWKVLLWIAKCKHGKVVRLSTGNPPKKVKSTITQYGSTVYIGMAMGGSAL